LDEGSIEIVGSIDGTLLGVNVGHNPHDSLHVRETPFSAHSSSVFIFLQFVGVSFKINVAFESEQGPQVSHVAGQCVSTLSNAHLFFVFSSTHSHVLFLYFLSLESFVLKAKVLSLQ